MPDAATEFLTTIWSALGGGAKWDARMEFIGEGALPSVFAVSDLAAASIGAAALAVADYADAGAAMTPAVSVDRRLASFWFGFSLKPIGWSLPPVWDAIAGDYSCADGWIKLHTNAAHHRQAALAVLATAGDKEAVRAAVKSWRADELEAAVVARGGCAATMRSLADWSRHPQGKLVASEPLVWLERTETSAPCVDAPDRARPLAGVRVLDLTRILAGPIATRFLAGFGAEVLRIDPPGWEEPTIAPEVTLGKRCARLDLGGAEGRERFLALLSEADAIIHGYRPDALERLGLGAETRRRARPGLIDVSLDAYGWTGPWTGRRGFDSLVQMSCGIADEGMRRAGADIPKPLPVPALDHATGYLMAAAAVRGLGARRASGKGSLARVSLARIAALLTSVAAPPDAPALTKPGDGDYAASAEATAWGPARRLRPPVKVEGAPVRWDIPAGALGSSAPRW
jgi:hypothetical protein